MPKTFNRLSARRVATIQQPGRHADGGNLYLSISPSGGRRWVFMFARQGKTVEMGLGSARPGQVSLGEAREKAEQARRLLREGMDPLSANKAAIGEVPTFGGYADELIEDLASGFSNAKHIDQWRMTLTEYAAPIRDKPINAISTADVLAVLKPLWTTRPETASRLRGRIERVLSAAKAKGVRDGDNPARWRGHLDQMLPRRQKLTRGHHAALPFDDMPIFMGKLRERDAPAARALEFLILSATRGGETRGARWSEFDLRQRTWTIPAARMKSKREHRIPLTPRMLEILVGTERRTDSDLIFPGPSRLKPLSDSAFKVLLHRMGYATITPHGFRSAFRDWAAERTAFPHEVAEMALAHVIANRTEAAYRRGDLFEKRRDLMQAWGVFCDDASGAHAASQSAS